MRGYRFIPSAKSGHQSPQYFKYLCAARYGKARLGWAGRGSVRLDKARCGKGDPRGCNPRVGPALINQFLLLIFARLGMSGRGEARQGSVRQGGARWGVAREIVGASAPADP